MALLPPLVGRSRRRGEPPPDPALDDVELADVRNQLSQGRWTRVRSLLARTGDDWDRRAHRLTVLADTKGAHAWAGDWLLAEPESADAAALLACAEVHRALRGRCSPDRARQSCHRAAGRAPNDPTPYFALLLLARHLGTEEAVLQLYDQVRARHPDHHHAHHLIIARLAERSPDKGQDPLHEVYDFAAWAAEQAPADSPLAVLPVVAHAERYRALAVAGQVPSEPETSGHWAGRRAQQTLRAAFDWWLEWEREDHPRSRVDLNFLAHAKHCAGRTAEAAALFHRIGPHRTESPWSYPDRDPHQAFRTARGLALGEA